MKKTAIFLCVVSFLAVVLYACKHTVENPTSTSTGSGTGTDGPGGGGTGGGTGSAGGICFESDVLPIFKSSCAKSGCHDAASQKEGYVFDRFDNIVKKDVRAGNADGSKVYKVLIDDDEDDRMPQRPNPRLTPTQIKLIKDWINEGAKNTVNCSSNCDTTAFTYSGVIRPLLDANCVGCHNSTTTGGGLNYTNYAGVQSVALNGRLMGAITHSAGFSPMPKNSAKLSDCKIIQVRKWVQAGAPNN